MKKLIFLFLLAFIVSFQVLFTPGTVFAQLSGAPAIPQKYIDLLPAGYTIPAELPTTIHDPLLLAGWVYLYNQQEPLHTWDSHDLTGRKIAQMIIDQRISVQWNVHKKYGGNSYSERPACHKKSCAEDRENHQPIMIDTHYLDPGQQNLANLADTLAHEMIHHMLPFGNIEDTLYEEFWAYSIGLQISKSKQLDLRGYSPLQATCLTQWFNMNHLTYYSGMQYYPQSIKDSALTGFPCMLGQ